MYTFSAITAVLPGKRVVLKLLSGTSGKLHHLVKYLFLCTHIFILNMCMKLINYKSNKYILDKRTENISPAGPSKSYSNERTELSTPKSIPASRKFYIKNDHFLN